MPSSSLHSNLITEVRSESIYSFPERLSLAESWRWKYSLMTSLFWSLPNAGESLWSVIVYNPDYWYKCYCCDFFISVFLSWEVFFHFSVLKLCKSLVTALSFLWVSEEINILSKLEIIWDSLKRIWICKSNLAFSQARHRKYHRNGLLFDKRTEQMK